MPLINDPQKQAEHLREAINGKQHWIFLTDNDNFRDIITTYAGFKGLQLGDKHLHYGDAALMNTKTSKITEYAFLTIPKSKMTRKEFETAGYVWGVLTVGRPMAKGSKKSDMMLVSKNIEDAQRFIQLMSDGCVKFQSGEGEN